MLKIMLADTDAENVKNYVKFIKMSHPEAKIVQNGRKGADFLDQVKEHSPNLIIADVLFFGAKARETLRDVYEFFPDKRFILYGTYNDAEYMERCMEYGVISYLFRPVKPADLEKSIKHAVKLFLEMERVAAERERLVAEYQSNISMFRDRFLDNLTGGHLTNDAEIRESLKYFGIKLNPGCCVITVRIDYFQKIILTLDEMEKYLLVYKILLIINENLKRADSGAAVVNRLNTVSVILGGNMPLLDVIKFCDDLRKDINLQAKTNVTIGVGRNYSELRDIAVSYKESESALRYRHYKGYNTVIPIHFVEPLNNITYRCSPEKEERLVYSAVTGDYERCLDLCGQIFSALRSCEPLPKKLLPRIIMDLLLSISRFASEQHIELGDVFTFIFPSKEVLSLTTIKEAHEFMEQSLKSFCLYMLDVKEENNKDIIKNVKAYINENYTRNVPLSEVAAHAHTTPEFLTEIFKKYEKKSVYKYAIDFRISKAAALLREDVSVADAAKAVGYDDVKYFNAVFKQHEGMTADEYKRMVHVRS